MKPFLWSALLSLACALPSFADKIFLKDGRTYEGKILEESETEVKLRTSKGAFTLPKAEIDKIERGTSPMEAMDEQLGKLRPENPEGYLEAVSWCVEQKIGDEQTITRLANIAMGLEPKLAGRGNLLLGNYQATKGDRVSAADYYFKAYLSDWKNPEAKKKLAEFKDALAERTRRQAQRLRDALTLAIDQKMTEAVTALNGVKNAPYANLIGTFCPGYRDIDALVSDILSRVPCKTCANKGTVPCSRCAGKGTLKCVPCNGTGKKVIKQGTTIIRTEKCTSCGGAAQNRCDKCVTTKGLLKCGTCKGIVPPKPTMVFDRNGLINFRTAVDARLSGVVPIEEQVGPKLPRLGTPQYDPDYVDEGKIVYEAGKWVGVGEKK